MTQERERLACFDEFAKLAGSPDEKEETANTSKVIQPSQPHEYRVVDPADLYVAPSKYTDKAIEVRGMQCFHADKDEYTVASHEA